ncbi:MAG TPA: D-2-hydroxyacid dehydrogenase [Candidatus Acidoferrales bacterium]|nr:D-2-hydroxyacid dehydrogenase [Candidatus Acidoferrales bacterium]
MDPLKLWIRAKLPEGEIEKLAQTFSAVHFLEDEEAQALLDAIEALFTEDPFPDALVRRMTNLRWIHVTRGGAYPFLTPTVKARPIVVTCSKGIHGLPFSEFALACIFALAKRLPQCWENQREKRWAKVAPEEVSGKTLGIIGLGTVGTELARKAKALGLRVLAIKRRVDVKPDCVDVLGTSAYLPALLAESDFVVISLASVPSTENMLGEKELRLLKRTAFLINLTAGRAVEEKALIRALSEGWFAGAALDAFERQPLPEDSPLWGLPNVLVSPRVAGISSRKWDDILPIFERNLRSFLAGEKLENVVDKELGY